MARDFIFKKNISLLKKMRYPFLKELFLFYCHNRLKYGSVSFYGEEDFKKFNRQKERLEEILDLSEPEERAVELRKLLQNSPLTGEIHSAEDIKKLKDFLKEEEGFQAGAFIPFFEEFQKAAEEFFPLFMERKKKEAALDIQDLLLFSLALLREHPSAGQSFSKEWDYWLIDEYQDTSRGQEQFFQKITGFKNVFCVGDPAQSIYLFRFADPYVFKRREKAMAGFVTELDTNRRSSASLIHFYNDFFTEDKGFMKFKPPPKKETGSDNPSLDKKTSLDSSFLDKKTDPDSPCVYFLTYELSKSRKAGDKQKAVSALYCHIQNLIRQGASYNDIAVLALKNDDLTEIAEGLRGFRLPLLLNSSKSFSEKRDILDALFLLKFLINPYDDTNLKALLRSPYFRLPDQELAQVCHDHFEWSKDKEACPLWPFLTDRLSDKTCVSSLKAYLLDCRAMGLKKAFEKALLSAGFMVLTRFQDPTGSLEANLWKLISLLNKKPSSALELFYSLMEKEGEENEGDKKEAPACEDSSSLELMSIHKSKGLQFEHVIVMDFSIAQSTLKSVRASKDSIIYDDQNNFNAEKFYPDKADSHSAGPGKMAFAVPLGGRDRSKVKSYGHKIFNKRREREFILEKDRLLYVAMTRAKQSLTLFIPNSPPEKNSYLEGADFFKNFSISGEESPLLETQYDEKNRRKLKLWQLNEGDYKMDHYCFRVQSCESLLSVEGNESQKTPLAESSSVFSAEGQKNIQEKVDDKSSLSLKSPVGSTKNIQEKEGEPSAFWQAGNPTTNEKDFQKKEGESSDSLSKKSKMLKAPLKIKSSQDFIDFMRSLEETPPAQARNANFKTEQSQSSAGVDPCKGKAGSAGLETEQSLENRNGKGGKDSSFSFYLPKAKNILFKAHLGNYLHFFLQKLSYHSLDRIQPLIESSFLSKEEKQKIHQALAYIIQLKEPDMSFFLRQNQAEWPFKVREGNILFQGQIDLWGWKDRQIHLFDYKSSRAPSVKQQLIFYSWILSRLYRPEKIYMYALYPFQKTFYKQPYSEANKNQVENWLKTL